ncbi:hypothetical protein HME9302_02222 [Alteripontixanthobacter maritimus]|uniref:PhiE125 gp8 family phage protein n=1 Tax=Alteripontixanthobacter maritimus TaxID=2161824 RepID=A0A369QBQ2_9SPHN|nr:hypothetical protein [Alteripontixanthobacter maritimus]RDC61005.1 hypothetical protein HME9302_02222 [Alteripontixanthobacter maritimus]
MKRAIIVPADLAGAALIELKQWLAITVVTHDAALVSVLRASIDMCEAYTGIMPLQVTAEETVAATAQWQSLAARPVQAITGVEVLPTEGARFALASDAYDIELDADGTGRIRVIRQGAAGRVVVRYVTGLAPVWEALPDALRSGVIRLAVHSWREREDGPAGIPPAAVAALWHPWRRMRLA